MKIHLVQVVDTDDKRWMQWSKDYNDMPVPSVGDSIEDPLWDNPGDYKVCSLTFNYCENTCFVYLEKYKGVIATERKEEMKRMAKLHGWETLVF